MLQDRNNDSCGVDMATLSHEHPVACHPTNPVGTRRTSSHTELGQVDAATASHCLHMPGTRQQGMLDLRSYPKKNELYHPVFQSNHS